MKYLITGSLLWTALALGCDRAGASRQAPENGGPSTDSEQIAYERQERQFQEQLDRTGRQLTTTDEQLRRVDEHLKKVDEQNRRYDALLEKWETQAQRFDAILDRWERLEAPRADQKSMRDNER